MLNVKLLGAGNAWYDDRRMEGFPGRQCHRLLCYLMLNLGRPHSRERLAAQFWSEYSTGASRTYLRNCLWRLREELAAVGASADEYLQCQDGHLSFQPTGRYWLDVEAFEEAAAPFREVAGRQLAPEQARSLEQAASLYAGDLLEGVYDDWCLYDRERLRMLYLQVLGRLMAYCEQAGSYERGLDYGQRILALDPAREWVHRQTMRLHWRLGSRGEALAQYKRCMQILRDEIGVAPAAQTRLLYEQMTHGRYDLGQCALPLAETSFAPPPPPPLSRAAEEPTLDRLRRLESLVDEVESEVKEMKRLIQGMATGDHQPGT